MGKKPIGSSGFARLTASPGVVTLSYEQTKFGRTKEDIEWTVALAFRRAWIRAGASILGIRMNKQDDFDFSLDLPGGTVDLELMECILDPDGSIPYRSEGDFETTDAVNALMARLRRKKIARYSPSGEPKHLLIYVTYWAYALPEAGLAMLRHILATEPHPFENVFYMDLLMGKRSPNLRVLFPSAEDTRLDPTSPEATDHWFMNLNPMKGQLLVESAKSKEES